MMRKGTSGGRRGFAVVAIVIALAVMAPELAAPASAAVTRNERRGELQTRPAALRTMTAAQKAKIQQYIRAHPQVLTKKKATKRRARVTRRRGKRRVSRRTLAAQRKRAARTRNAKTRKRRVRRGAAGAKHAKSKKKKKGATSTTTKMIHGIALIFLIGLPFIAVGLLLFGTDYRRRPRAVSNKKRRRVLVITPVGRKY